MEKGTAMRVCIFAIIAFTASFMAGCAHLEKGPADKRTQYWFFHKPLPEASRALEQARQAGKDQECPAEYQAAEDMVDKAYEAYNACRTKEAIDMAQKAIGKIIELCPPKPIAEKPVVRPVEKVTAPPPAPKQVKKIIVLAFEDIYFDFDKSTLTMAAAKKLKNNIRVLTENPESKIRIVGYASASGSEAYNQKLSERRADTVKTYLITEGGLAAERFNTIGYGETKPLVNETNPKDINSEAAKANMRVRFEIIKK